MRQPKRYNFIAAAIALSLLLAGCAKNTDTFSDNDSQSDIDASDNAVIIEAPSDETENTGYTAADSVFTLNYNSTASLNPLYGLNTYNNDVFSLVYEGLFRLNNEFEPEPVLCSDYSTSDGITFTFTLVPGVKFHDGEELTASDVEYTINRAAGSSKYSSRLKSVIAVNARDDQTLVITLSSANYGFPALLDIPIIENGSGGDSCPAGTGPYMVKKSGNSVYLTAFSSYRDAGNIPIDNIYLTELEPSELSEAFSGRVIDILDYDPTGNMSFNIHTDYETRRYNTTDFIYMGFNTSSGVTSSSAFRKAISRLVDIDTICTSVYENAVVASPLILSPALSYYDKEWEKDIGYSRQSFAEYIMESGFTDSDNNGFWESPSYGNFTLTIIVNSESDAKIAVANMIATELKNNGISAEVISLSWDRYVENLTAGTFNMYIGEAKIPADFNFTELLTYGGSLNYGKIDSESYQALIRSFLAAAADEKTDAAKSLCSYVAEEAPIVPIAYKEYAVISHIGVISGLVPSQTGIFSGITECSINME